MCVGLAEILSRKKDFSQQKGIKRIDYLHSKPVPLVRNANGEMWILDRHHRLRALLELDENAKAYGYVIAEIQSAKRLDILSFLKGQGWLFLYNRRGIGPIEPDLLPISLLEMEDDPYRSLVWKLKKEGFVMPAQQIPYHEFRWAAWLRRRPLPPFNSRNLSPALPAARNLVISKAASKLYGWKGERN